MCDNIAVENFMMNFLENLLSGFSFLKEKEEKKGKLRIH